MDNYTIVFLPPAEDALADRFAYIEDKTSRFAAENYASGLFAYIEKNLTHNPQKFRTYDYVEHGLRLAFYKKTTTIVYTIDDINKIVAISNIFHTHEDYIKKL